MGKNYDYELNETFEDLGLRNLITLFLGAAVYI
jgi:hypothetical protein